MCPRSNVQSDPLARRSVYRLIAVALTILAATITQGSRAAQAEYSRARDTWVGSRATRVYVFRGLGDQLFSSAVDEIGEQIRRRDPHALVRVENWHEWDDILADASAHPGDRVVLIGFSMGARAAGLAANELARGGLDVKVVGIDPACADAAVDPSRHIRAVSFYATTCGAGGQMRGARNVRVGTTEGLGLFKVAGHTAFPSDPVVQQLVSDEALRDDFGAGRRRAGASVPPRWVRDGVSGWRAARGGSRRVARLGRSSRTATVHAGNPRGPASHGGRMRRADG